MKKFLLAHFIFFSLQKAAMACAVCFGDPNSKANKAIFAGVLILLAVVGTVLGGILSAIVSYARRSKRLAGKIL